MGYGRKHAELYDVVFASRGKDWAAEATEIAEVVRDRHAGAVSLLDVACGTGAHLATFATLFDRVEGLEPAAAMREVAEQRVPGLVVHEADMRDFELGRTYDAITCLFFAITYMPSVEAMVSAIGAMARHLTPEGVLVIEPWWFEDQFIDGYVGGHLVREDGRVIARVTHSVRQGAAVQLRIRFVVADRDGISEFTETEVVSLFTKADYHRAFDLAGCTAVHLPGGANGTGRFVAQRLR